MTEIVKADLGKAGFLQERLEAVRGDVASVKELLGL
jgi:hypothetical protein